MSRLVRYIEQCHCGHAKATHWEEKHNCLGMLCECRMYIDRDDPDRKERTQAPAPVLPTVNVTEYVDWVSVTPMVPHPWWCACTDCVAAGAGMP